MKERKAWSLFMRLGRAPARWTLWRGTSKTTSCLRKSWRWKKYEEKLPGSGCPRITNCTNVHTPDHIYYVSTLRHQSYCSRSYMKGSTGVTQEEDPYPTGPLLRDIGGRGCRGKPWSTLRNVTSAKSSPQIFINRVGSSTLYPAYGYSPSGAWILWDLSQRQQEIRDIYWSAQITLPSGSKPSPWPTSGTWTLRNSSRETSSHDSGSLAPSFQIMGSSLIVRPSENIAVSWRSLTGTQLQPILKGTVKPRLSRRS